MKAVKKPPVMKDSNRHAPHFHGDPERLRAPDRVALLEVERVVALSIKNLAARSLLDVGTGTGVFAEAFCELVPVVIGLDACAELLAVARGIVSKARFLKARAEHIPFADHSFDVVFLGHVLHELDHPLRVLKEVRRVVRGRVVVLEWPHEAQEQGPPLERRLSPEAIKKLAGKAGFGLEEGGRLAHMALYRLTP